MFSAIIDNVENSRVNKYQITCNGTPVTYSDVLDLWGSDTGFRTYFTILLAGSQFAAYRFETPALTNNTAMLPFEFVLINSPGLCSRHTDASTYNNYFTDDNINAGIVTFANLSGDATLIVPSPRTDDDAYGHIAAFIRRAPETQVDAFWRVIGATLKLRQSDKPIWLSTAGGGVAWLHARLDSMPKYYGHWPYKETA